MADVYLEIQREFASLDAEAVYTFGDMKLTEFKPTIQANPSQANPSQANPSQANPSQANPSQANQARRFYLMPTQTAPHPSETRERTSRNLGWEGVVVETRMHPGGESALPSLNDHHLCLNLGLPVSVELGEGKGPVRQTRIGSGAAVIVPAGQPSLWRHTDMVHHLHVYLSRALLERTAAQIQSAQTGILSGVDPVPFYDPHVEQLALLLRLEMESDAPNGNLYAETLSSALSVRLLQRENDQAQLPLLTPSATKLRRELRLAAEYIRDNLASDLSLSAIAWEVGLSPYHFARLFTEAFGIAPHQYIIQARIEWAKSLITRDGLPLGDAAQRVGFSDQSHFTRHFKRLVGETPRVFARGLGRKIVL